MQILQLLGAGLLLTAYFRRHKLDPLTEHLLNMLGALLLFITALFPPQWGFLLLNATWGTVAAKRLIKALAGT